MDIQERFPVETQVPNYGLKVKLNHKYPENRSQDYRPRLSQIWAMLPLILRYIWYFIKYKITNRSIVMDYFKVLRSKQNYGVPLGGIGCGTIGRGYKGEFCRFQLRPGLYEYNTVAANQFIVTIKDTNDETIFHSLLSTYKKKGLKSWTSSLDGSKCSYTGLYPRAWTEYDLSQYGVVITCRQISPVIPNNYKDSSLPCSVFVWSIRNVCDEPRTVTIAFTFKNGTGDKKRDRASRCSSKSASGPEFESVVLSHSIYDMPCTYALSVNSTSPDIGISKCLYIDPNSDGSAAWNQLKDLGNFEKLTDKYSADILGEMACGIAAKVHVPSDTTENIEMNLVWDMPHISFPKKMQKYYRYYTEHFGRDGALLKIADYAFKNYSLWEKAIYDWQKDVLDDDKLPDWYKSALFNETYFVSDGGTVWLVLDEEEAKKLPDKDLRKTFGRFSYLEGHEYRMCNTYDVHFYASFALAMNWPLLQYSLQYDMRDAIFVEIEEKVEMLYNGKMVERKKPNTVPHDVGDPGEEPFILLNSYPIHDVSEWRDLNTKFVLQVFRDVFMQDLNDVTKQYLADMYGACYTVMKKSEAFDIDKDGLIENSGTPDQTYDTWVMTGSSAYCGGLWLAALFAMVKMAEVLDKTDDVEEFKALLEKGKDSFENKLWNGKYYNFDCSEKQCRSIMADQLCGQWYLKSSGFNYEVFRQDRVVTTLKTIFANNVMAFCSGTMGAVNGFIDGDVDYFTTQSEEIWTGTVYGLSATMIQEGLLEEAFQTAGGMYKSMTEKFGLAFDTPEALYAKKYYRAIGYMRPLSIWSMQLAVNQLKKDDKN